MKRILIAGDSRKAKAVQAIENVKPDIAKAAQVVEADLAESPDLESVEADIACVFGGDGSLLRVVSLLGANQIPVVGVNVGRLGFLTEFSEKELLEALPGILSGEIAPSSRMMLDIRLLHGGKEVQGWHALNEAVMIRLHHIQMISFRITIDQVEITEVRGDGVMAATPTGSTAYSLSAGGAIVVPGAEAICITPVNPHTVTSRPLVVSAASTVEIELLTERDGVVVSVDGQGDHGVKSGDVLRVVKSDRRCRLVESRTFFETLRTKLRWGGSPAAFSRRAGEQESS
jgi:NAD+ kinase